MPPGASAPVQLLDAVADLWGVLEGGGDGAAFQGGFQTGKEVGRDVGVDVFEDHRQLGDPAGRFGHLVGDLGGDVRNVELFVLRPLGDGDGLAGGQGNGGEF